MVSLDTKRCVQCERRRRIKFFYKNSNMTGGHFSKCVDCTKQNVHANYRNKIEEKRAYEKKRWRRPERRKWAQEALRLHRARNPLKYVARNAVNNAIRDGRLQRKSCEICGKKAQAHHDDYSKPLDVRWFCFAHHRALHGQQTAPEVVPEVVPRK